MAAQGLLDPDSDIEEPIDFKVIDCKEDVPIGWRRATKNEAKRVQLIKLTSDGKDIKRAKEEEQQNEDLATEMPAPLPDEANCLQITTEDSVIVKGIAEDEYGGSESSPLERLQQLSNSKEAVKKAEVLAALQNAVASSDLELLEGAVKDANASDVGATTIKHAETEVATRSVLQKFLNEQYRELTCGHLVDHLNVLTETELGQDASLTVEAESLQITSQDGAIVKRITEGGNGGSPSLLVEQLKQLSESQEAVKIGEARAALQKAIGSWDSALAGAIEHAIVVGVDATTIKHAKSEAAARSVLEPHLDKLFHSPIYGDLVDHLHDLAEIELGQDPSVTDRVLEEIAKHCKDLILIDIGNPKVTDAGVQEIAHNCPSLKSIGLNGTHVGDSAIQEIAKHCPNLTDILLQHTQVTDVSIMELAKGCSNLQCLEVQHTKVTDDGVMVLANGCASLKVVKYMGSNVTDKCAKEVNDEYSTKNGSRPLRQSHCSEPA